MKLIIQIPAFNEAKTIGKVIESLPKELPGVGEIECLVIDDGSTDETAKLAKEAGAIVVSHPTNLGLGIGFQTGRRTALDRGADVLVTIDADGQFPAEDIPRLIEPIRAGRAHFVTASRFLHPKYQAVGIPWIKKWGNGLVAKMISRLAGGNYTDVSCGFRAYSREALMKLNLFGDFTYTHETFLNIANQQLTIEEVPVEVTYFPDRKSKMAYSIGRYGYRTIWIIFRTVLDHRPFTVFSAIAAIFFLAGVASGMIPLVNKIQTGAFTPYKIFGFLAGFLIAMAILIFCIGLVSDILNRLRITQERLLYEQRSTRKKK